MKKRILIVDDMELNRELLQEMLEEEYDVLQAENGKQAMECLEKMNGELS